MTTRAEPPSKYQLLARRIIVGMLEQSAARRPVRQSADVPRIGRVYPRTGIDGDAGTKTPCVLN